MSCRVAQRDRRAAVYPQSNLFEAEMVLQGKQVSKMRVGADVGDVPRRESAVAPIEANDRTFLGHRLVLLDETAMVPLMFEVRQGRAGERVHQRWPLTEHRVCQRYVVAGTDEPDRGQLHSGTVGTCRWKTHPLLTAAAHATAPHPAKCRAPQPGNGHSLARTEQPMTGGAEFLRSTVWIASVQVRYARVSLNDETSASFMTCIRATLDLWISFVRFRR